MRRWLVRVVAVDVDDDQPPGVSIEHQQLLVVLGVEQLTELAADQIGFERGAQLGTGLGRPGDDLQLLLDSNLPLALVLPRPAA